MVVARPVRAVSAVARVAAIDCGTNSLRLLVADVDPVAGRLTDVDRRMEIVRLGQGVDATGRLAPEALDRTLHALAGYAKIIKATSADAVRMVATSATRDAANAADFVRGVEGVLGVPPEVLSGQDEAYLSFTGATAELAAAAAPRPAGRRPWRAARTWSWTSAAGRPSSCSGTASHPATRPRAPASARCPWTSAVSG